MEELVLVYRTYDAFKAHFIKSELDNLGIYCQVQTNDASGTLPHLGFAQGGIQIRVFKKDFEEANKVILEIENSEVESEE